MPAYNAARTLERTYADIPHDAGPADHPRRRRLERRDRRDRPAAGPRRDHPQPEPRLRRQPEDLLRRGARGRRGHRRDAPPGLPVRRDADPGPRRADRRRRARPDARQPVPGRPAGGRHAPLEVRHQPLPDRAREPGLRAPPVRVPHGPARLQPPPARDHPYHLNSDDFVFDQELDRPGGGGGDAPPDRRDRGPDTLLRRGPRRSGSSAAWSTASRPCASSRATSCTAGPRSRKLLARDDARTDGARRPCASAPGRSWGRLSASPSVSSRSGLVLRSVDLAAVVDILGTAAGLDRRHAHLRVHRRRGARGSLADPAGADRHRRGTGGSSATPTSAISRTTSCRPGSASSCAATRSAKVRASAGRPCSGPSSWNAWSTRSWWSGSPPSACRPERPWRDVERGPSRPRLRDAARHRAGPRGRGPPASGAERVVAFAGRWPRVIELGAPAARRAVEWRPGRG